MPKVLLQDLRTLRYLSPEGEWTPEPETAQDFGQIIYAADFLFNRKLHHVRVVLWFSGAEAQVALPPVQAYA